MAILGADGQPIANAGMSGSDPRIIDANGKAVAAYEEADGALRVAKWKPKQGMRCNSDSFCEGMQGMLLDGANRQGNRITAVGADQRPTAIGFLWEGPQILSMFNNCPCCGGALKLEENSRWD